jgi:hypothetical protein
LRVRVKNKMFKSFTCQNPLLRVKWNPSDFFWAQHLSHLLLVLIRPQDYKIENGDQSQIKDLIGWNLDLSPFQPIRCLRLRLVSNHSSIFFTPDQHSLNKVYSVQKSDKFIYFSLLWTMNGLAYINRRVSPLHGFCVLRVY